MSIRKKTRPLQIKSRLLDLFLKDKKFSFENALFFGVVLFLPTQLGKHFWPEFSFLYSLKIDYFAPTVYFWDLLMILLFGLFLLEGVKRRVWVANKTATSLLLVFILSQAGSLLLGGSLEIGLVRLGQYLIGGALGIYIASQEIAKIRTPLLWGLKIALVFESVLAIGQFMLGRTLGFWILGERTFSLSTPSIARFNFLSEVFLRAYGTFSHPNILAAFLILGFLIVWYLERPKGWQDGLVYVLGAIGVMVTFSRVAILILLVELLVVLRKKLKVLVLLGAILLPLLGVRFNSVFNFDSLSISRREELAQVSIDQFRRSPLLGVGLNNFILESSHSLTVGPNRFLQPVHNIFLLTLAETGLLGVAGFLILLLYPIIKLTKKINRRRMIVFAIWGSLILLGLFDHFFLTTVQGQRLFFLIWGLSMLECFNGDVKEGVESD